MEFEFTGLPPRWFSVELDGKEFSGRTGKDALLLWMAHCGQRDGRLMPEWDLVFWAAAKAKYPRYVSRGAKVTDPGVSVTAAKSFLSFVLRGGLLSKPVEAVEARRRAAICSECPMAKPVMACSVCKAALKWVGQPEKLEVPEGCGACGCWLRAKVWIRRDLLGSADDFFYSETCWMREQDVASDASRV